MVGASVDELEIGVHTNVQVRHGIGAEWIDIPVMVLREVTFKEYEAYQNELGNPAHPSQVEGIRYYEISID